MERKRDGLDPAKAGDKQTAKNSRRKILRELKKIKMAWPELNSTTALGVLIFSPSKPTMLTGQHLSLTEIAPRVHPRKER